MKKYLSIAISIFAALLSAAMIYFRKDLGSVELVKQLAQIWMPIALGAVLGLLPGGARRKVYGLIFGLLTFYIVLSLLSPFAFEYWVRQATPAGYLYSRYDMDALYPWLGWIFCGLGWALGMLVGVSQEKYVLRKLSKEKKIH